MNDTHPVQTRNVMYGKFLEIDGLATVAEAITAMKENNTQVIIVKKRNEHDEYGIVLLADIAKKVLARDQSPDRVNIYEIMSKPVIGVDPDMDVRYCARMFERFGLSVAPVIENKKVIGIVSYRDLVFKGL